MKDFIQRNATAIASITAIAFVIIFLLFGLLIAARELQLETLTRIDQPANGAAPLGRENKISKRSEYEIRTILKATPHVMGGWISKTHYGKTEMPVIYFYSKDPLIDKTMKALAENQASGQGWSSAELSAGAESAQLLRNSEEARNGLIKCGPLSATNLPKLVPELLSGKAKGVCRAPIPPFDENINLALMVVIDVDWEQNGPEVQEVRRALLQLQIDIFNRDYQGRETWVNP